MGVNVPVSLKERDAILHDIDLGMNRNELARKHRRSPSTISKIAAQNGRSFDRTKTAAATEAFQVDMASRRAKLADALLDDAERLRKRLWEESHTWMGGPNGPERVHLDLPTLPDARQGMTGVAVAIKAHTDLVKIDQPDGDANAKSLLAGLAEAFGIKPATNG